MPGYLPPASIESHPRKQLVPASENRGVSGASPPLSPTRTFPKENHDPLSKQPSRPELLEEKVPADVIYNNGPSAERTAHRSRSAHQNRAEPPHPPSQGPHHRTVVSSSSTSYEVRPTEGNERFALLMSKRSASPQLRSVNYISPTLPLKNIPLAAEILEYEHRLQSLSRANGATRGESLTRSANYPMQDVNMYMTLARSHQSDALSAFGSRSLYSRNRGELTHSMSQSHAIGLGSKHFGKSVGSSVGGQSSNIMSRSLESGMFQNAKQADRVSQPKWAQYTFS
jgi:hypothetical protein